MAHLNVSTIASGDLGTLQTIGKMRSLVNVSLRDPKVIETARSIVALCMPRDLDCRAKSIKTWLDDHFQFVHDPVGVELVATPRYMLDRIERAYFAQGDCDDAAVLGAALGKAVGLRARFVTLGFHVPAGPYAHVFTVLRGTVGPGHGGRWIPLDVTRPVRNVPQATRIAQTEV